MGQKSSDQLINQKTSESEKTTTLVDRSLALAVLKLYSLILGEGGSRTE
jgi:hypothetical protein